jgi:DNA-binding IclR family transcriptional regulator
MGRASGQAGEKPAGTSGRRRQYSAPALEKGLDMLELLAGEEGGLSLREIATKLNRSTGEIFRMLAVLEQRGYIAPSPTSDSYSLTIKMFELARQHLPIRQLSRVATAEMQRFASAVEQSCHVAVYHGGRALIVLQQDSPSDRVFSVRLGAEAPLLTTCSGRILLSFSDPQMREHMLREQPSNMRGDMSPKTIERMVARIRAQGCERVMSTMMQGVQDVGYPVFDYLGRVQAAIVVPYLAHLNGARQYSPEQVQRRLQEAARTISESLGYRASATVTG